MSPKIIPQTRPPPPPPAVSFGISRDLAEDSPDLAALANSQTPYLDRRVLEALAHPATQETQTSLQEIISHYLDETGAVLDVSLAYESRPGQDRRVDFGSELSEAAGAGTSSKDVVTVVHCARDSASGEHKITVSSGFAVNTSFGKGASQDELADTLIVTCAHTLEQIRQSPLLRLKEIPPRDPSHHVATGTFICIGSGTSMKVFPASKIVSALPRSDVILVSCSLPKDVIKPLPLSPYPARPDAKVRAHFVSHQKPPGSKNWKSWVGDTYSNWVPGQVLGYRDFSGREAQPGTYDALSHMLFNPPPTPGSSGGPIVDEESGAVVGIMLGSRVDEETGRLGGVRGWGIPGETVYEMFSLPGLEGKK